MHPLNVHAPRQPLQLRKVLLIGHLLPVLVLQPFCFQPFTQEVMPGRHARSEVPPACAHLPSSLDGPLTAAPLAPELPVWTLLPPGPGAGSSVPPLELQPAALGLRPPVRPLLHNPQPPAGRGPTRRTSQRKCTCPSRPSLWGNPGPVRASFSPHTPAPPLPFGSRPDTTPPPGKDTWTSLHNHPKSPGEVKQSRLPLMVNMLSV